MTESDVVSATQTPATVDSLLVDLRRLGVREGATLIVHSSLSGLGWVVGREQAVVDAMLRAVGKSGTIVMPTHSGHMSDPSAWSNPAVPETWWQTYRDEAPAFDPLLTPTLRMGAIVECFRHVPGVIRSNHPSVSFAAVGPYARRVTDDHELANGLGEGSPLARLYELDAQVLLLGVGHTNNTSLHLGEYRSKCADLLRTRHSSPFTVNGSRRWVTFDDLEGDDSDFEQIGAAFSAVGSESTGTVGAGIGRLMSQRAVVDFAAGWMNMHR